MFTKNALFLAFLFLMLSANAQRFYSPRSSQNNLYPLWMWILDPSTNEITLDSMVGQPQTPTLIPSNPLCQYQNALYGISWVDKTYSHFLIYRCDPDNHRVEVVCPSGAGMQGTAFTPLVELDGKLYGVTQTGGNGGKGMIFVFDPESALFQVLHSFSTVTESSPSDRLIRIGDVLYGITRYGGTYGQGSIFSYTPATSQYQMLHAFQSPNGRYPQTMTAMGNSLIGFAGSVSSGNPMNPICFTWDLVSGTFSNKGLVPSLGNVAGAVLHGKNLYFFMPYYSIFDFGRIASWDLKGDIVTTHKLFYCQEDSCPDGSHPFDLVWPVKSGNTLYGLLREGGTSVDGNAFSWDILTGAYSKLNYISNYSVYKEWCLFDKALSADSEQVKAAIKLFPNPVKGQCTVQVPQQLIGTQIIFSSIAGKEIRRWAAQATQTLDITELPAGIYLLKVGEEVARLVVE